MRTQLLERAAHLEALDAAVASAAAGTGRVVLIEGGVGVGKTALLHAVGASSRPRGVAVLAARGVELELDLTFGVVRQLLGADVPVPAGATADPVSVIPDLFRHTVDLAEETAVVVTIDDAHWADPASLRFLAFLAGRIAHVPACLVLAARPDGHPAWTQVRDTLVAVAETVVLELATLSEHATGELLADRLGERLGPDVTRSVHEMTGGNPLLVTEVGRALGDASTERSPESVRELAPRAVSRAVLARLGRMPEPSIALARAVSVHPDGVGLRHAAAQADIDAAAAAAAADQLAAIEILEPGRPLRFLHPAMRAAVYDDLPFGWRAAQHRRAADLLVGEGAPPERVAGHLLHVEPAGDPAVAAILREAAARAAAAGATEAAIRYLERALEEPVEPAQRPPVLWELGRMLVRLGDPAATAPLLEAHGSWPQRPPVELTCDLARGHGLSWDSSKAIEVIDAGLDDPALTPASRELLSAELLWHAYFTEPRPAFATRLAELADDLPGESLAQCTILGLQAAASADRLDHHDTAARLATRALGGGHLFSGNVSSPMVVLVLGTLRACDRLALADEQWAQLEAIAAARGADGVTQAATAMRADVLLLRGKVADAHAQARFSVELAERTAAGFGVHGFSMWALMNVLRVRGEPQAALAAARQLEARGPELIIGTVRHARGRALAALGDYEAAEAELLEARAASEALGLLNPGYIAQPDFDLVGVWLRLGRREEAVALAESTLERARRFASPWVLGEALRVRALAADPRSALVHLDEAVAVLRGSEARLVLAGAVMDHGAALRRAGRLPAAREVLRESLMLAHQMGAMALAERATEELRAAGGRIRQPVLAGALTPAELRVARLGAAGLSNRDIGHRLFLSVRTVESHLGAIFRKLGISGRSELRAALDAEDAQGSVRTGPE